MAASWTCDCHALQFLLVSFDACLDIEEVSGSFWQFVPVGRLADRHFFDFVGETGSPRFLRLR